MPSSSNAPISNRGTRRSRAVQACIGCRKTKARCELLDNLDSTAVLRCHRCKTLNLPCSYQDADRQALRAGRKSGISQAWEQLVDFTDLEAVSQPGPSTTTVSVTTPTCAVDSEHLPASDSTHAHSPASPAPLELKVLPRSIWNYRRVSIGQWRYCGTGTDDDGYDLVWPMSAVHQISTKADTLARKVGQVETLEEILEQSQIDELLRIFQQNYLPWLGFSVIQSHSFPLLDLVRCTIASRHLSQSSLVNRLLYATEGAISQIIIHPSPTYVLESIQALLLVTTWSPISVSEANQLQAWKDPHLLLSSAISLATKIGLDKAPENYSALKRCKSQGAEVDEEQLENARDLTRLWISLTNAESLACIGTARTTFSYRGTAYLKCFPRSTSKSNAPSSNHEAEAKDVRLRLLAETLHATEMGLALRLTSISDFETWYHSMAEALQRIDGCVRILLPLGVVLDFDQMYFRTQTIISRCCRLLVLNNSIQAARFLSPISKIHTEVFTPWGKDAVQLSEEIFVILIELLELLERNRTVDGGHTNSSSLSTAPDHLFHLIQFAGVFLISFKFVVLNARKYALPGVGDVLLERVIQLLRRLEVPREHPARKCVDLLEGLLGLWTNREKVLPQQQQLQVCLEPGQGDANEHDPVYNADRDNSNPNLNASLSFPIPVPSTTMDPFQSSLTVGGFNAFVSLDGMLNLMSMPMPMSMSIFTGGKSEGVMDGTSSPGNGLSQHDHDAIFQNVEFWQNLNLST
ncbi:hypothetical protein BT96DRAFT_912288 [Gymnopus androsaceus JB14]|uniref:Zn(2)-C6 fungal-type domain-containing protein n=1 Tax=Gymnopus androsaceus JB14 TaxID=1447944 RepID=A0A6A4IQX3_9AGAR|nr:hypothetical protein BT96DRAFT_912288 [Gymnopus androsaceus JB14]